MIASISSPLVREEQALIEEYFSRFSEEEMRYEMSDEEEKEFHEDLKRWTYEHASEELKIYWEYQNWVGDEGQLCDGKGHPLLYDSNNRWSWIQDWDINEEGYCLYKGTQELILNTDGSPIKNPTLEERIWDLL